MNTSLSPEAPHYDMTMGLRMVLAITNELISCPDVDSTLRHGIEAARARLGLERCAIFLERDGVMHGTYGTDIHGSTTDERTLVMEIKGAWNDLLERLKPEDAQWIVVEDTHTNWEANRVIKLEKRGWIIFTRILLADGARGVLVNDTTISGAPINPMQQEIIAVYCSLLGKILTTKRVEESVRQALEKERELGEMKSRFIANISHEFRTPLTLIQSSVELLKHYGSRIPNDEKLCRYDGINEQIQQMTSILDNVLTIHRAEKVGLAFNPRPLDIVQWCAACVEAAHVTINHTHRIVLEANATSALYALDENLLHSILTHLLNNALKYSQVGSTIHLNLHCEPQQLTISIQDEGIGIPADEQKHVFQEFFRAKNVGTISGTGLGMSIVKRAVEAHGGSVTFSSTEGQGTTFSVTLPTPMLNGHGSEAFPSPR